MGDHFLSPLVLTKLLFLFLFTPCNNSVHGSDTCLFQRTRFFPFILLFALSHLWLIFFFFFSFFLSFFPFFSFWWIFKFLQKSTTSRKNDRNLSWKHGDGFSNKKQHRHVLLGCCRWTFPDPSQAIVHWPCMWQVSHRAIRIMLFKSVQSRSSIVNRMLVTINKLLHLFFFFLLIHIHDWLPYVTVQFIKLLL